MQNDKFNVILKFWPKKTEIYVLQYVNDMIIVVFKPDKCKGFMS